MVAAWSEKPGCLASKMDGKGSGCTGTVRKVKVSAVLPALGPMGDPVVNRGADEPVESFTGLEVEVAAVYAAHEQVKAFEQSGHPVADGVQLLRELGGSRPWCPMKRRAAAFEVVHPVEKEHMEVNIEVQRRTEPLDQGDATGPGARSDGEPRLLDEESRDRTVDDALDLTQYPRPGARPDTPAWRLAAWAAIPEHSHAARDGARWMARNRSRRASLTRLTASRSLTAKADRSSSAKVTPSLRQALAPGRDFSFA